MLRQNFADYIDESHADLELQRACSNPSFLGFPFDVSELPRLGSASASSVFPHRHTLLLINFIRIKIPPYGIRKCF